MQKEGQQSILVITTGGTIFQKFQPADQKMVLLTTVDELLKEIRYPCAMKVPPHTKELNVRSGAELTFDTIFAVQGIVLENPSYSGYVLVTGTDTMDEFSFILSLLLNQLLVAQRKAFAVVGSMKPADVLGYDGVANLQDALMVACHAEALTTGVLLVMNDNIHLPAYVRKSDSQLIGSFRSHPGPIGQIRGGQPLFYYQPHARLHQPTWDFSDLRLADVRQRVCIWTVTVSGFIPEELLQVIDGLVIAGAGTGSLPSAMIQQLSPKWTSKLPIVITTRCDTGANYDDHYYRGSKHRYTSRGFLLEGYEHLSAVQARSLLIFQISKHGTEAVLQGKC